MNKVLICYAYCEVQKSMLASKSSIHNLNFFLNNAVIDDVKYTFCINVNGDSKFNFEPYKKKYSNLNILYNNGKCQVDGYINIFKNVNINEYKYFFILADKVLGPFNIDKKTNWIDFFCSHLDKFKVIISAYGTSPLGKLYKFPYIPMKFMCFDLDVFKLFEKTNFWVKSKYNTSDKSYYYDTERQVEIQMSHLLLDNNINYVALDKKGIINLNILKHYKNNDPKVLFELNKQTHAVNDIRTIYRIFWSDKSMKKIFIDKDSNFINKLNKKRDVTKLKKW